MRWRAISAIPRPLAFRAVLHYMPGHCGAEGGACVEDVMSITRWSPDSWRIKSVAQAPAYPEPAALAEV